VVLRKSAKLRTTTTKRKRGRVLPIAPTTNSDPAGETEKLRGGQGGREGLLLSNADKLCIYCDSTGAPTQGNISREKGGMESESRGTRRKKFQEEEGRGRSSISGRGVFF